MGSAVFDGEEARNGIAVAASILVILPHTLYHYQPRDQLDVKHDRVGKREVASLYVSTDNLSGEKSPAMMCTPKTLCSSIPGPYM